MRKYNTHTHTQAQMEVDSEAADSIQFQSWDKKCEWVEIQEPVESFERK